MSNVEEEWQPKQEYLNTLLSMGITHNTAVEALFCTGNKSIDDAVNYVFNNEEQNDELPASVVDYNPTAAGSEDVNFYKMTFVVNSALKMGVGKIAAQVGHACLGLYRDMQRQNMADVLNEWEYIGEKKIVLRGVDHVHLQELYEKAQAASIPAHLIRDAGHTQIPEGSVTVLSIFGLEEEVDKITGKLSLL